MPQLIFYQEELQHLLERNFGPDASGLFVEFDLTVVEALRDNENDKAKRRTMYVDAGMMSVNEAREELGLPPVEWGTGPPKD